MLQFVAFSIGMMIKKKNKAKKTERSKLCIFFYQFILMTSISILLLYPHERIVSDHTKYSKIQSKR